MKFRPLHDRVVIRRAEGDLKSKGGIIIPDNAKEKPQEGEVIAVGPGLRDESGKLIPLDVKAGDTILFGKWSGTEVKIDGEDLLIMKESRHHGRRRKERNGRRQGRLNRRSALSPIPNRTGRTSCLPRKSNSPTTRATACCAASNCSTTPSR
jgi:chaperonin GroES